MTFLKVKYTLRDELLFLESNVRGVAIRNRCPCSRLDLAPPQTGIKIKTNYYSVFRKTAFGATLAAVIRLILNYS